MFDILSIQRCAPRSTRGAFLSATSCVIIKVNGDVLGVIMAQTETNSSEPQEISADELLTILQESEQEIQNEVEGE